VGGKNLGACWRRLNPQRLRVQVGGVAFKRGATPLEGNHVFALPSCIVSSHLPSPRAGDARNPSVLSSEERNFVEVGTFQPSFGFKNFHHAARPHPLAGGHPRRRPPASGWGGASQAAILVPPSASRMFIILAGAEIGLSWSSTSRTGSWVSPPPSAFKGEGAHWPCERGGLRQRGAGRRWVSPAPAC
jgi:hypothetical protein